MQYCRMEGYNASKGSQASSFMKTTSRASRNKTWTTTECRYLVRFMATQVEEGFKVDKGFKPQAIHNAIQAMKKVFGVTVTEANVSSQIKTIRRSCARVTKLKEMSGMGWDDNSEMIINLFVIFHIVTPIDHAFT